MKRIQEWFCPRNQNEVRNILENATYYRKLIKTFFQIADSLNKLLQKPISFNMEKRVKNRLQRSKKCLVK